MTTTMMNDDDYDDYGTCMTIVQVDEEGVGRLPTSRLEPHRRIMIDMDAYHPACNATIAVQHINNQW